MTEAYIGIGSNMGDKVRAVRGAAELLQGFEGIEALELSPLYRTAPVGVTDQEWFVNAVARLETQLSARELLERCLEAERVFGRQRIARWGPRTLDLDVLIYGDSEVDEPGLTIPHPRMLERAFVLAPLSDLDAGRLVKGRTVRSWLADLEGEQVERLG